MNSRLIEPNETVLNLPTTDYVVFVFSPSCFIYLQMNERLVVSCFVRRERKQAIFGEVHRSRRLGRSWRWRVGAGATGVIRCK